MVYLYHTGVKGGVEMAEERIRVNVYVERNLWKQFMEICKKKDLAASWVLRNFIRETVQKKSIPVETEAPENT